MPDISLENKNGDQQLDCPADASDQQVEAAGGLVGRTQQLLDEVDQLLGIPADSESNETPQSEAEPTGQVDGAASTDSLANFLSEFRHTSETKEYKEGTSNTDSSCNAEHETQEQRVYESAATTEKLRSSDEPLLSTIETRLSTMEASMDSMLQQLEHRIDSMFASLTTQLKYLSTSASLIEENADSTIGDLKELADETDLTLDEDEDSAIESAEADETGNDQSSNETEDATLVDQLLGQDGDETGGSGDERIKALKDELTSKLREAEIELSINRAKLSQQKATIEQMQADLTRREALLDEKLEQAKKMGLDKKKGLLNRWKRHMGDEDGK